MMNNKNNKFNIKMKYKYYKISNKKMNNNCPY